MRVVVDLPAPFGPRSPKISPCLTTRSMPATATRSPKRRPDPPLRSASCHAPPSTAFWPWRLTIFSMRVSCQRTGRPMARAVCGSNSITNIAAEPGSRSSHAPPSRACAMRSWGTEPRCAGADRTVLRGLHGVLAAPQVRAHQRVSLWRPEARTASRGCAGRVSRVASRSRPRAHAASVG
jgi:hypothetical protein